MLGVPFEDVVFMLDKQNIVIDWIDFFNEAVENGWKPERTINRICFVCRDVYGTKYSEEVNKRLLFYQRRSNMT